MLTDTFTPEQRSRIMSRNRPQGNRSTEWALRARLASAGISGWRVNSLDILGHPDFVFPKARLIVFVDGCFWHGCNKHKSIPQKNRTFWEKKIYGNIARDKRVSRKLRRAGWHVYRFWEHDMKKRPNYVVAKIRQCLEQASSSPHAHPVPEQ